MTRYDNIPRDNQKPKNKMAFLLILTLPFTHYVTLNKSSPLSGPQFSQQFFFKKKEEEEKLKSLRVFDLLMAQRCEEKGNTGHERTL